MSSRSDRSTLLRRDWLNTTVQTDWSKTAPLVQGTVTALTEQTDLKHRTEPNRTLVSGPSQFTQSTSTNEFVFTHWNYLFGISGWSRRRTPPPHPTLGAVLPPRPSSLTLRSTSTTSSSCFLPNEGYERQGEAPYRACWADDFHGNTETAPGGAIKSERGECQPGAKRRRWRSEVEVEQEKEGEEGGGGGRSCHR